MLQNKKMVIPGLVLALALGGFTLAHAATKTAPSAPKSPATTASVTKTAPAKEVKPAAQPQPKLSQDQVTKIALAAHKDAKVGEVKLVIESGKPFYMVKLDTAKGTRELKIGGNSGKIFKDTLTVAAKTTK